ncbi:MAG: 4-hydroxybutyrate CoA-transferase, partial [Deltaproteobacteria bacterium]|nr:4-hydroxybutyrate CoA-transferase [Deltaproteobacteria bacterium]
MDKPKQTEYDPNWQDKYKNMIATPGQAVSHLRPGQRVFIGTGCGEPKELVKALTDRASKLADMEIIQLLTLGEAPYAHKELADCFLVNSFFVAENVRGLIQEGLGKYTPIFLSDIPRLFSSGQLPLDAALIQVTPPDERGRVSLGVSVDIVKSAAENASLVIAQVNPQMPRTMGDSFIDIYDLDFLVPVDTPIFEATLPESTEVTREIGERIAALVEDGSTVGFSVGRTPHAVIDFLKEKQN